MYTSISFFQKLAVLQLQSLHMDHKSRCGVHFGTVTALVREKDSQSPMASEKLDGRLKIPIQSPICATEKSSKNLLVFRRVPVFSICGDRQVMYFILNKFL